MAKPRTIKKDIIAPAVSCNSGATSLEEEWTILVQTDWGLTFIGRYWHTARWCDGAWRDLIHCWLFFDKISPTISILYINNYLVIFPYNQYHLRMLTGTWCIQKGNFAQSSDKTKKFKHLLWSIHHTKASKVAIGKAKESHIDHWVDVIIKYNVSVIPWLDVAKCKEWIKCKPHDNQETK